MPNEHRRKRVRKGTKSCWECKRRKIKCIYPSEDHLICAGCVEKRATCLSQEYVDDQPPDRGDTALAQRVERVESLLKTVIERIPQVGRGGDYPELTLPRENVSRPPLSSQFDSPNTVSMQPDSTSRSFTLDTAAEREALRRRLAAMLPCQEDVDFLFRSSHGWWLIQQHMMPHLPEVPENDPFKLFNVSAASKGHPIAIARLLLCVAICFQQLPAGTDLRKLQTTSPVQELMETIIKFIFATVTSNDEMTGSVEGVECLALQGIYHVNAGNLRRAWLSFRKAIDIAQLMGLHRANPSKEIPDPMGTKRHHLWYQISKGERYLSILLGVPSSTGTAVFPFDDNAPWLSTEDLYHKSLYYISGQILARNQDEFTHSFSATQKIDEQLESLTKQMPPAWWDIPTTLIDGRTKEASAQFERIMCHIWHFELAAMLHLPFMLRAANDRRYQYSQISCLNACRSLIKRWISIRDNQSMMLFSNLIEFQAFTAATTLLLGLLGTDNSFRQERYEDTILVDTVMQTFESLEKHDAGMSVSKQSISVIQTLQRVLQNDLSLSRNLRLEIPYFGIISVTRTGTVSSLEGERILGANARPSLGFLSSSSAAASNLIPARDQIQNIGSSENLDDNGISNTVMNFTSDHFHVPEAPNTLGIGEWPFQESDMIFFDGLVNTDLVGSWNIQP